MATKIEGKQDTSKTFTWLNEIVAIILLGIVILTFLSIISFTPADLPPNSTSFGNKHNWIGFFGAYLAHFLFSTIGLATYLVPVLIALIAWRVFKSEILIPSKSRILGYILTILSTSGLLWLFVSHSGVSGGIIGAFLAETILVSLVGTIGAGILLTTLFLIAILLITNLSYFSALGDFSVAFGDYKIRFGRWFKSYREWRDAQNAQAAARLEKRLESRLEKEQKSVEEIKTPTISIGEKIKPAEVKTNEESPAINLKELKASKAQSIEDVLDDEEFADLIPKISTGGEIAVKESAAGDVVADSFKSLNEEISPISISPIKETGDLEGVEFEEKEIETTAPVKTKPQNYDGYILPMPEFLVPAPPRVDQKDEELLAVAQELTEKTKEFNVTGRIMHILQGPVVTTYEFKPDAGVKYSRIVGLADDLCLALKAESIRIDRIPGKAYVGIEVPNLNRETIFLREVIESKKFQSSESKLTIALGKSIDGLNYSADLAKMPHLLIAGATGAGKSVGVNTLVVSILYKAKPDEVKFIMVDPKQVELGIYNDIPHLATPIITDPKRAAISLKWAVSEMEKRYKNLAGWGVRNLDGYNAEVKKRNDAEQFDDNGEPWKKLPYIVIIIDELADLMMVAGKEVEESITRLAQMARAVGIHLVLATQRPSVDVITGLIKANFPARISFRVSSKIDSRTIIDANGSEKLLGRGDMLFLPPATSQIVRVHGAFVDEKEINKIVEHIKAQGKPEYDTSITKTEEEMDDSGDLPGKRDPLFMDALRSVISAKRASTSLLQRHLRIGYGRAAAILDAMVREGYIGEMDGSSRARPILEKAYEFLEGYDSAGN